MQKLSSIRSAVAGLVLCLSLSACNMSQPITFLNQTATSKPDTKVNNGSTFPYQPLVYHLDLSILAYQLYAQSLVWPFDPYYEEHDRRGGDRPGIMQKVHNWAALKGNEQVANSIGINAYRGPGSLIGFAGNANHDPIIYDYSKIYPWSNTLTNADGKWTEYLTPKTITGRIKDTYVCSHRAGSPGQSVAFEKLPTGNRGSAANATDTLLAFEGGTGDKGEAGRPASQSLMGYILARTKAEGGYDIHIAFRGSRSGSAGRAVLEAMSDSKAKGNPDWITDLGYNRISSDQGSAAISTIGKIHRGFATSMKSIHPNLFHCLNKVSDLKKGNAPGNIYVTGHSLGGALAQTFVASVLLGNRYGPNGTGPGLPSSLRGWPWTNIKLITFSAPRIGDARFAEKLTTVSLQSEFFSTQINPVDTDALKPNDPSVVNRLSDPNKPAAYRILHSKDPITSEKGAGGKHVGKTIYVNTPGMQDLVSPPDFSAHEQRKIRDLMLSVLSDSRLPRLAMRYRKMSDINPARNASNKGTREEMQKLATALKSYYSRQNIWFDHAAFDRDFAIRMSIEQGP